MIERTAQRKSGLARSNRSLPWKSWTRIGWLQKLSARIHEPELRRAAACRSARTHARHRRCRPGRPRARAACGAQPAAGEHHAVRCARRSERRVGRPAHARALARQRADPGAPGRLATRAGATDPRGPRLAAAAVRTARVAVLAGPPRRARAAHPRHRRSRAAARRGAELRQHRRPAAAGLARGRTRRAAAPAQPLRHAGVGAEERAARR